MSKANSDFLPGCWAVYFQDENQTVYLCVLEFETQTQTAKWSCKGLCKDQNRSTKVTPILKQIAAFCIPSNISTLLKEVSSGTTEMLDYCC